MAIYTFYTFSFTTVSIAMFSILTFWVPHWLIVLAFQTLSARALIFAICNYRHAFARNLFLAILTRSTCSITTYIVAVRNIFVTRGSSQTQITCLATDAITVWDLCFAVWNYMHTDVIICSNYLIVNAIETGICCVIVGFAIINFWNTLTI